MAASLSSGDEDGGVMSDINVTPLVDVVLVLLIVFMITVPAIVGSTPIRVNLPLTSSAFDPTAEQLPLNISLKRDDAGKVAIYWNETKMSSEEEFRKKLTDLHPNRDQEVSISGDQDLVYGNVIHIMDMLAAVGIHKMSLNTKHIGG